MASGPTHRVSCPSRSRNLVCKIPMSLLGLSETNTIGYYSNRMSYDEVAGLLTRVTGQHVLSDQTMQHLGVTKAVEVSQQWQIESQADTAASPSLAVTPQV